MSSTPENSDPYLFPGTSVLKNLRGLTDPEQLERFEARRTHQRIAELINNPLPGTLDLTHLKAVHRYIFQDVLRMGRTVSDREYLQGRLSFRAR